MPIPHKHTEYSKINDYIYIGTNFCCQKHLDKNLLKKGITADISLEEIRMDTPFGVKCYLWLPVKDHYPPTMYQFLIGVSCIDNAVKTKNKIYVHCKNGHGRAPTLVAAYLIIQGMSVKETIDFLRSKRAGVNILPAQLSALTKFQKSYKNFLEILMNTIKEKIKKLLTVLAPVLGTGAVGVCPLCWAASASFLSYIGLGLLIPVWRKIAIGFLILSVVGFIFDYHRHRNIIPLILLLIGGVTLYVGRYIFVVQPKLHIFSGIEGFAGWPIWGLGGLLVIVAVFYNQLLFRKPKSK